MDTLDICRGPVIDIMIPGSPFQETILEKHILVDPATGDRIPTLEAAIVSKYAALVSPNRSLARKQYAGGDFRLMVQSNHSDIDRSSLQSLAGGVREGGAADILDFLARALGDQAFEI